MGMTVVKATFPTRGEVWSVSLEWSRDGETFRPANVGLPRAWDLFRSVSYLDDQTTVLVPVAGFFATSEQMLFFQESGRYWFRIKVTFRDASKPRTAPDQRDPNIEPVVVERIVDVGPPLEADLDFIAGLAQPELIRAMFGEDFFTRKVPEAREYYADAEVRAVKVIARFLVATREKWVGDVVRTVPPNGDVQKAAHALLALARRFPKSSYAPYAAYYAGCCYAGIAITQAEEAIRERRALGELKDEVELGVFRAERMQNDANRATAHEAFALAGQRADAYLKPRVLYQHGNLHLVLFDFDASRRLLAEGLECVPGVDIVREWTREALEGIEVVKARLQEATKREDESSND
jgi:hypothetical protein